MKLIPVLLLLLTPSLAAAEPVNINTADAPTLARELKGVGEARAQAIVEHRGQHGPFRSADELVLVKGIGQKVVDQNRANIRVDRAPRPAPTAASSSALPAARLVGTPRSPSPR